ncbi:MAG: hypothetical protein ACRDM7_07390 [Thermoleophilaceae bacterium]
MIQLAIRCHPCVDIGWLIEFELDERDPRLAGGRLAEALRDMRLLGLQPTLLSPRAKETGSVRIWRQEVRCSR